MCLIYFIKYVHIKTIMYEKKIAFKKSNILVESVKKYADCVRLETSIFGTSQMT